MQTKSLQMASSVKGNVNFLIWIIMKAQLGSGKSFLHRLLLAKQQLNPFGKVYFGTWYICNVCNTLYDCMFIKHCLSRGSEGQ